MTVSEWTRYAQDRLCRQGIPGAATEARVLATHVLLVDHAFLLAHPEAPFPDLAGEALLARRLGGEPLAYITGEREFFSRRFRVNWGVLIPRQETELLVETAITRAPNGAAVVDVGTGSGAIAVSLSLARPDLRVYATDVSPDALAVAQENANRLGASIDLMDADLLSPFRADSLDLVVSNPPYIAAEDHLPVDVRDFEPAVALFGGPDGLDIYRRLLLQSANRLRSGGEIMVEIGAGQEPEVRKIGEDVGLKFEVSLPDFNLHPRVLIFAKD